MSRRKGANGEREVVRRLQAAGIPAKRTAPLQADEQIHGEQFPDVTVGEKKDYAEVRYRQNPAVHAWAVEVEQKAGGRRWFIFWRRNNERLRVTMDFDTWIALYKKSEGLS